MSKFRDKAADIKAAGEAQRGNFTPSGVPLRLYNFWLENSDGKKAKSIKFKGKKENFCHFWRVVAIWAPLLFLGLKIEALLKMRHTPAVMTVLLVVGVIVGSFFGGGLQALAALLVVAFAMLAILGLVVGLFALGDKYPRQAAVVCKWVGAASGVVLPGIILLFLIDVGGWVTVTLLAVGALIGLVVRLNIERISDYIHYRRAKKEEAEDARLAARDEAYEAYLKGEGPNPYATKFRKPNAFERKMAAFFRGIGDFIIMAAQVVRVNKWKICPVVEVDTK